LCKKKPSWKYCSIFKKCVALYHDTLKPATMKLLSESIRSFFEGFVSFYTSIYNEMKTW
jgi:hypothetical protein